MSQTVSNLVEQVKAELQYGGSLSEKLPEYEERPAQITMAIEVAQALESGMHTIIEAGTGTGKSLAYLLPIIFSKKVAIISTANKALQEQLFYKDIPFINENIQPVRAAMVKGMGNYLCLDRFEEQFRENALFPTPELEKVHESMNDQSFNGDLDLLPYHLTPSLRSAINADADLCSWSACPHFTNCYVRMMRETARTSQIIVVNHTLLLLDAALEGWLLPERDVIVIDEAHHLEDEATRAFTITVTPQQVQSLLQQRRLVQHVDPYLLNETMQVNAEAWTQMSRIMGKSAASKVSINQPIQEGLSLADRIESLAENLKYHKPEFMDDKETQLYEKLIKRTRSLSESLKIAFGVNEPQKRVYYAERIASRHSRRQRHQQEDRPNLISLSAAPLEIGQLLANGFFSRTSVIATSATLAVGEDFSYFCKQVGLPISETRHHILPLAFDYANNALLYIPRTIPEPSYGEESKYYLDAIAQEMLKLIEASHGRAFLLFSSQRAMLEVYARMQGETQYPLLCQGSLPNAELTRQFRETPNAVLFGVKSFWEGVDIAGETLSLVAIDKLPFAPPDDPVHQKRLNIMKEAGEDWFSDSVLPHAILQLKQGLGRLLRTRTDHGVMAVLDSRIHSKRYGRYVLMSLPPARRTVSMSDVVDFLKNKNMEPGT